MSCICCLGSALFLCGTIYWVRKMTLTSSENELKADSLNNKMVVSHIFLILAQSAVTIVGGFDLVKGYGQYYISECVIYVISAALDTFVCCLICILISDNNFHLNFRQGTQAEH
jgi:hypothetical protein